MVIAIEVIYNMGGPDLAFANNDGWTLKTKDNSLAGLFERTIAITKSGPLVLTP
jgi:methionyl aminopeptidase